MNFTILPQKKEKKQASQQDYRMISYVLAFLIPLMTLLVIMQYFSFAPFGEKNLFVSQGAFYNLTIVTDTINSIRNGTFHWLTLSGGTGLEYYSTFAYYLCSPFTLICLLFPQDMAVSLLSVFSVLRISASAPIFMYYLSHKEFGHKTDRNTFDPSLLLFGLGYALSSYALVQYNDFMFLDIFMLFPLLMLGLERLICKKGNRLFYIVLSVCLFSNFYLGLILIPFMLVYLILKCNQNLTDLMKAALRFLGFSLLAIGTSAITVIPGMAGMYRSVISTTQVSPATNVQDYFTFFYQHLFYNYPSYLKQAYWGYNLYVGLAALMLAILYFFAKKERWQVRLRNLILVILMVMTLQFHPFAYMMHLKNGAATYYNCYAFIYLFLLLFLAYDGLHNLMDIPPVLFGIGLFLPITLAFVSIAVSTTAPNFSSVQASTAIMIFYAILLVLYRKKSIKKNTLFYFLLVCGALELMANAFQNSTYIAQSSAPVEKCLVTEASSSSDENILQLRGEILNGTRQYRTTTYGLNSRYSVNPLLTDQAAQTFSPLEDAMMGLQSLYVRSEGENTLPNEVQYSKSGSDREYDIYENKYVFPTAYFVENDSLTEDSVSHATFFAGQNSLAKALGATDVLYEDAGLHFSITQKGDTLIRDLGNNMYSFHTKATSEDAKQLSLSFDVNFTPEKSGDLYLFTHNLIHFGEVEAGKEYTYTFQISPALLGDDVYWFQDAFLSHDVMQSLARQTASSQIAIHYNSMSRLTMQTDATANGTIVTYLPFSKDFHVYVDGRKTEASSLDGYLCIPVSEGTHTILLSYEYMPFYYGLWITLFTILGMLLYSFAMRRIRIPALQNAEHKLTTAVLTFSGWCKENYVYLLAFAVPFISIAGYMIYLSCEPFGGLISLYCGDAIHDWLPNFSETNLLSAKGWPSHSWTVGGGYGILSIYSSVHLPSINWLAVPYSHVVSYYSYYWLFMLSLCGVSLVYYLTHRLTGTRADKRDPRLLIAALTYCMCNYFLTMLNNTGWYIAFLLLPLLILQMDYLMIKGQKRGYIIMLSLAVLSNYYMMMFICIYMVVRFFTYHFDGFLDFIKKGIRFALCSLCIIGPAFNTLYFATHTLIDSTYSEADSNTVKATSSFLFNGFEYIFNRQRIFSNTAIISWNEGDVNLYFGILALLLVCLYCFSKGIKWQEKLRQLIPYGLFFIALNQPFINYVINGFHYQHGVPNRFAFLLPFMAAGIGYDVLVHLKKQDWKRILIPAVLLSGVFGISEFLAAADEKNMTALIVTLVFLALYTGLLMLMCYGRKWRRTLTVCMILVFIVEMNINESSKLAENYGFSYPIYYTQEASGLLHKEFGIDDELSRVTIPNPLCTNYPFSDNVKGSAMFTGGSITKYQLRFAEYNGLSTVSNALQTTDSQTLMGNALSGTKYIMVNTPCDTADIRDLKYYKPVAYTDNAIVLENAHIFPFGYYLPSEVTDYDYTKKEHETVDDTASFWNTISKSLLPDSPDLVDTVLVCNKFYMPDVETNYMEKEVVSEVEKYFNCNVTMPSSGTLYARVSAFQYVGEYQEGENVPFTLDISNYSDATPKAATNMFVFHDDVFYDLEKAIKKNAFEVTSFTDETVEGTIDMPEDGILNFSMPYDRQWQVTVDGAPVETHALADAYLYIELPKGTHTVQMTYVDNRWVFAAVVTVGSWILLALAIVIKDLCVKRKR